MKHSSVEYFVFRLYFSLFLFSTFFLHLYDETALFSFVQIYYLRKHKTNNPKIEIQLNDVDHKVIYFNHSNKERQKKIHVQEKLLVVN